MMFRHPYNPPDGSEHVGKWFKREIFQPNELQGKEVAKQTIISEAKLSKFLNQKIDIDNDLALRLSHFINSIIANQQPFPEQYLPEDLICAHARYKFRQYLDKFNRDMKIFQSAIHFSPPLQNNPEREDSVSKDSPPKDSVSKDSVSKDSTSEDSNSENSNSEDSTSKDHSEI